MLFYRYLLILLIFVLSGCGFEPMNLGSGSANDSLLSKVKIADISGIGGTRLQRELIQNITPMGPPDHPQYILQVTMSETKASIGILKDATASRYQTTMDATFTLTDNQDYKTLLMGKSTATGNFSVISSPLNWEEDNTSHFKTHVAEASATNRNMKQLARNIKMQLLVFMRRQQEGLDTGSLSEMAPLIKAKDKKEVFLEDQSE